LGSRGDPRGGEGAVSEEAGMPGRRGRSSKRSPEPNLGPSGSAMISRPTVALAHFVTEDYLWEPSSLPDGIVICHEDIAPTLCGRLGATEMVSERAVRAV